MSKEHKVAKRLSPSGDDTMSEKDDKSNDSVDDTTGDSTLDSVNSDDGENEQDESQESAAKEQETIPNSDESNSQPDSQQQDDADSGSHKMDVSEDNMQDQRPNLSRLGSSSSAAARKRIALNVDPNAILLSTPSQTPPQVSTLIPAAAAIPENILSPPKSETQTDETNTATSTSTSPASDTELSSSSTPPFVAREPAAGEAQSTTTATSRGANPKLHAPRPHTAAILHQQKLLPINGSIPKSGKPLSVTVLNKKMKSPARAPRSRKPKVSLPMYESEISDNKIGIKLCIKKSENIDVDAAATATTSTTSSKSMRKRSRKAKQQKVDSDESEYEPRKKRTGSSGTNNNGDRQKRVSFSTATVTSLERKAEQPRSVIGQSVWALRLPEEVLLQIFQLVVNKEGSLPTLFRLGRVCSLWRQVSLRSSLWRSIDLTTLMKEKHRTELKLKWFVDNRCSACTDLNVSNWKVSDINCFLSKLANGCPNLMGITLSGWKGFTSDHLTILVENMKKLQRLDLSSINVEMNASKSAVGIQSLCNALQTMGSRLTHLYLAHNRLAGIPQIVNILSTHCPNLTLLDLSNVTTQATSHGVLHIEKLQRGCQKLRVLRVTNSHITPSTANIQDMMESPGFPNLEELSVAALTDESRIISDDHLQRILKSSAKLKLLDVRNCTRLTHESLIRLPAWDIKHLFLSGCLVTRDVGSGLELIASKWAHSLIELDLAWANVQQPLDNALRALAEKGSDSPLAHLNLCGSSVSEAAVKEILANCAYMSSINLASCRGLPRGVKRLMQGQQELHELREVLKVQLKVKIPARRLHLQQSSSADDAGGGGVNDGDSGGGNGSKKCN